MAKAKRPRKSPVRSRAPRKPAAKASRAAAAVVTPHAGTVPVVGIGASAGGLEAISRLLQQLPATTGMAYVIVQHLSPTHESVLPGLLSAVSTLPVVQATDEMVLEPNRVHVIPPNTELTMAHGRLRLAPRRHDRSPHNPIDAFFSSVARHAEGRVVGIVLSGSASDGAVGLREIKTVGGITFAQEPKSAKHDAMPRAAIATGAVDFILTPEQMAAELGRVAQHPFIRRPERSAEASGGISESQYEALFSLLRTASGVDFSQYKQPTIRRRLQRRMVLHKIANVDDYLKVLTHDAAEVQSLFRDILIHVTRFFRDPDSYEAMKKVVFPKIVEEAAGKRPIRVWIPGCATGEEAYSVAIALLEYAGDQASTMPIQIFATDVSDEAVDRARLGVYPESITADVSPERLRRFFVRSDGNYRVSKLVRDCCIFARQDLTRDPPFSKLDAIVCRNVLIYLGARLQRQLLSMFHYALKPAGFLIVGATESVGPHAALFSIVEKRHKIYAKRAVRSGADVDYPAIEGRLEHEHQPRRVPAARGQHRQIDLSSEVTRLLIGRYSPPGVVVDSEFQIVQTRGKTGPYLELASGDPSLNVLKMAREGLLHGVREALQEARKHLRPVRREGLLVRANGTARETDVQVIPLTDAKETPYFLVLFEPPARKRASAERRVPPPADKKQRDERIERMQQELSSSREYLQSIIQDLEAANEELQSANEEILSSNEELQSTNEELDTAKEELQSTNEELNTVNDELNARNEELSHVNSDLVNLLTAVPAAIVIVTADLRIRRFTPLAEQVLNLIPTDIGRPLGDLKPNIDAPDLQELTRDVIDTVAVKELEARDRAGRRYSIRIRPYKNQEQRIDGAVLSFADLDEANRANVSGAIDEFAQALIDTFPVGVLLVGDDLRVRAVNRALLAAVGSSGSAVRGRFLREVRHRQWDQPTLSAALDQLRTAGEPFAAVTIELTHPRRRVVTVDGHRVDGSAHFEPCMVLMVRDATAAESGSA